MTRGKRVQLAPAVLCATSPASAELLASAPAAAASSCSSAAGTSQQQLLDAQQPPPGEGARARHPTHAPRGRAARGLADGPRVRVRSRVGSVEVRSQLTDEVMPGVVSLPHGWGHGRPGVRLRVTARTPASASTI